MSERPDVDEILRRASADESPPEPNIQEVRARARRRTVKRWAGGGVVVAAVGLAFSFSLAVLSPLGDHEEDSAAVGSGPLVISCGKADQSVSDNEVIPKNDGVHLEIVNTSPRDITIFLGSGTRTVPAGTTELVLPMAPGLIFASCDADEQPSPIARVVDHLGVYVHPSLDGCESPIGGGPAELVVIGPASEDPLEVLRTVPAGFLTPRQRPSDTLSRVGYTESESEALVLVEREGRRIAILELVIDGSHWTYSGEEFCEP